MQLPLSSATAVPFRGSWAVRDGRITPGRLRGPSFVPLLPDVHVGADATVDAAVLRRALVLWGGPRAVVAGSLAADALRVETVDLVPELVVPSSRVAPRPGMLVSVGHLRPEEVVTVLGVRVTSPVRTAYDLARRHGIADGVAMADALGHRHRFGPAALREMAGRHPGGRHVRRVRAVADLMDRLAESLPESRVRVALVLRGVPVPELQHRVHTPAGVFRLDMAWPELGVAVEYDGDEHRRAERHGRDPDRDAALADLGWDVVRVTGAQLGRPDALADRILAKLAARRRDRA